jgi:hypothetical protein
LAAGEAAAEGDAAAAALGAGAGVGLAGAVVGAGGVVGDGAAAGWQALSVSTAVNNAQRSNTGLLTIGLLLLRTDSISAALEY